MALSRVALVSHNPPSLALFYQTALGFRRGEARRPAAAGQAPRVAERLCLRCGESEVELLAYEPPGRAFPAGQPANSRSFQHFAIVTPDIAAAYDTLRGVAGWRPISADGPVRLPAASGGATAFKFRDPEGHPLELIQLAGDRGPARIDHTAIVVADTAASLAFYGRHGLARQGGSLNQGAEQAALDGLDAPVVEVTRLGDAAGILRLELLCYRTAAATPPVAINDVAATRLVFDHTRPAQSLDPDGHHLELIE